MLDSADGPFQNAVLFPWAGIPIGILMDPYDRAPAWIRIGLLGVVVYSLVVLCLESVDELAWLEPWFRVSELVVVTIFVGEYLAFWWMSDDRLRYPFRVFPLIDLAALLPYVLDVSGAFLALRGLRLLRLLRVLKLARHAGGNALSLAVRRAIPDLCGTAFVAGLVVLLASIGMYYAEHDTQPEVYTSVPATMWCTVVTLTTVGYGDMCPTTLAGRIIAAAVMVLGVALIAVPTSLISSNLTEILQERRERQRLHLRQSVRFRED